VQYSWLSSPIKKKLIHELRSILESHPRYRGDAQNVQNKFAFTERPQRGIILNNTSADRVRLSADNYIGCLSSFCMLAYYTDFPGTTIEWVRENSDLLYKISPKRNIFPSHPGVYNISITEVPDEAHNIPGKFVITPLLTITNEPLIVFSSSGDFDAQLSHENIYPGSVRLWLDQRIALLEGVDFIVENTTGYVTFLKPTPTGYSVSADYRFIIPDQGPLDFKSEEFDATSIPGVVIAFGDRAQKGDRLSIVVTDERVDTASIYGGKFEINTELIVFTRDAEDREKMSDYVIIKMLERQNDLGFLGIELLDISPGGESEEVYNEATDDYFYDSTISLSLRVDWESYIPLPIEVEAIRMTSKSAEQETGYLDGTFPYDLLKTGSPVEVAGVNTIIGRNIGYERTR